MEDALNGMNAPPTNAELSRGLEALRVDMKEEFRNIKHEIASLGGTLVHEKVWYVEKEALLGHIQMAETRLNEKIEDLEDRHEDYEVRQARNSRLVVTSVVTAIVSFISVFLSDLLR